MIFVTLADISYEQLLAALQHESHAEIRLDRLSLTLEQVRIVFSAQATLIATCRPGKYTDRQRKKLFTTAIDAGAAFIDIEIESNNDFIREMVGYARQKGCTVIISHHDYQSTPEVRKLESIVRKCFKWGADVVKIVTMVNSESDRAKILSLYTSDKKIVAFGMGEKGRLTRIVSLLMGAPFTYASPQQGMEAAPGQIDKATMQKIIQSIELI